MRSACDTLILIGKWQLLFGCFFTMEFKIGNCETGKDR